MTSIVMDRPAGFEWGIASPLRFCSLSDDFEGYVVGFFTDEMDDEGYVLLDPATGERRLGTRDDLEEND